MYIIYFYIGIVLSLLTLGITLLTFHLILHLKDKAHQNPNKPCYHLQFLSVHGVVCTYIPMYPCTKYKLGQIAIALLRCQTTAIGSELLTSVAQTPICNRLQATVAASPAAAVAAAAAAVAATVTTTRTARCGCSSLCMFDPCTLSVHCAL